MRRRSRERGKERVRDSVSVMNVEVEVEDPRFPSLLWTIVFLLRIQKRRLWYRDPLLKKRENDQDHVVDVAESARGLSSSVVSSSIPADSDV